METHKETEEVVSSILKKLPTKKDVNHKIDKIKYLLTSLEKGKLLNNKNIVQIWKHLKLLEIEVTK